MTSFTLLHFAWNRANHCGGLAVNWCHKSVEGRLAIGYGGKFHFSGRPTIRLPSFDLHRRQWSLLNCFRTGQGHCNACHKKWGFMDNELCDCGEIQTMSHIVNFCPLTKFDGGLLRLLWSRWGCHRLVDNIWLLVQDNNNNNTPGGKSVTSNGAGGSPAEAIIRQLFGDICDRAGPFWKFEKNLHMAARKSRFGFSLTPRFSVSVLKL